MYRVFVNAGRHNIAVMNLVGKNRVLIPLEGEGMIEGTIRVMLDQERRQVEIDDSSKSNNAASLQILDLFLLQKEGNSAMSPGQQGEYKLRAPATLLNPLD